MRSNQSKEVPSTSGPKTLRHTSMKGKIDLRTRYKRDEELIAPVVERSGHRAFVQDASDVYLPDPHHNTRLSPLFNTALLESQRTEIQLRDVELGKSLSPSPTHQYTLPLLSPPARPLAPHHVRIRALASQAQESSVQTSPTPSIPSSPPQRLLPPLPVSAQTSPAPSSQVSDASILRSSSLTYTPLTNPTTSSQSAFTSSSQVSSDPSSSPATPPSKASSYALEPLDVDHITRPTPAETAEIIDTAGLRYISHLPEQTSRIGSTISLLRRFKSWMLLRKHGF